MRATYSVAGRTLVRFDDAPLPPGDREIQSAFTAAVFAGLFIYAVAGLAAAVVVTAVATTAFGVLATVEASD